MSIHDEGYIKFTCRFTERDLPVPVPDILLAYRDQLYSMQLIGMYPDGIGYGNISMRTGDGIQFLITGTQTGNKYPIQTSDFCLVTEVDIDKNTVHGTGNIQASSETMTHAACYMANVHVHMVMHIHHAGMWQYYLNKLPTVSDQITYGTPEMARAVMSLLRQHQTSGCIITAGHAEGLFIYGNTPQDAMQLCQQLFYNWSANNG